jgi:hypothetical protein
MKTDILKIKIEQIFLLKENFEFKLASRFVTYLRVKFLIMIGLVFILKMVIKKELKLAQFTGEEN